MNFYSKILIAAASAATIAACSRNAPPPPNGEPRTETAIETTGTNETLASSEADQAASGEMNSSSDTASAATTSSDDARSVAAHDNQRGPRQSAAVHKRAKRAARARTIKSRTLNENGTLQEEGLRLRGERSAATVSQPSQDDFDGTASGSTSAAEETSTRSSVRVDASEPSTMIPPYVGSTGLSGQDRGLASAGHRGVLNPADLVARERATALPPLRSEDLTRYDYDRRDGFKSAMRARLQALDGKIDEAQTRAKNAAEPQRSRLTDLSSQLERGRDMAHEKLAQADAVLKERWSGYKIEFRDAVAEVERSFHRLETAMAR